MPRLSLCRVDDGFPSLSLHQASGPVELDVHTFAKVIAARGEFFLDLLGQYAAAAAVGLQRTWSDVEVRVTREGRGYYSTVVLSVGIAGDRRRHTTDWSSLVEHRLTFVDRDPRVLDPYVSGGPPHLEVDTVAPTLPLRYAPDDFCPVGYDPSALRVHPAYARAQEAVAADWERMPMDVAEGFLDSLLEYSTLPGRDVVLRGRKSKQVSRPEAVSIIFHASA